MDRVTFTLWGVVDGERLAELAHGTQAECRSYAIHVAVKAIERGRIVSVSDRGDHVSITAARPNGATYTTEVVRNEV